MEELRTQLAHRSRVQCARGQLRDRMALIGLGSKNVEKMGKSKWVWFSQGSCLRINQTQFPIFLYTPTALTTLSLSTCRLQMRPSRDALKEEGSLLLISHTPPAAPSHLPIHNPVLCPCREYLLRITLASNPAVSGWGRGGQWVGESEAIEGGGRGRRAGVRKRQNATCMSEGVMIALWDG